MRHGTPFLFADGIRIAYSFELTFLPQTMASFVKDFKLIDEWFGQWARKFSANKSAVLVRKFYIPPGGLFTNSLPMLATVCKRSRLAIRLLIQFTRASASSNCKCGQDDWPHHWKILHSKVQTGVTQITLWTTTAALLYSFLKHSASWSCPNRRSTTGIHKEIS